MKKNKTDVVLAAVVATVTTLALISYLLTNESDDATQKMQKEIASAKKTLQNLLQKIENLVTKLKTMNTAEVKVAFEKKLAVIKSSLKDLNTSKFAQSSHEIIKKAKAKLFELEKEIKSEAIKVEAKTVKAAREKVFKPIGKLTKKTVQELKTLAKELEIKFVSTIKKAELIRKIQAKMQSKHK